MKSDKIVIVGGGSAGWMSAAFLCKTFPNKKIVVIESKDISTVGVGESTLGDITNFRDYLGIDDKEFLRATNGSYKMSIKFTDFYKKDSGSFHYPFRYPELSETTSGIIDWFEIKALYPETPIADFVRSYFPHSYLFEQNKFSENKYGQFGNFNPKTDVAYHFDASAFGNWLKNNYCIPRGVTHVEATVTDISIFEDGVEHLLLDSGEKIYSDLFIDCTGFKSVLLSGALKEPFISYQDILPNNRAWAVQVPYIDKEKELEPFTNCTAIGHGWCWNIPLWSRLGTGYVYSDQFISPEEAKEEYKQYLMSDKMLIPRTREQVDALKFNDVKMRVGIHERTWVKNVVALGLSAGFIEPLESNGLFTVQWFLTHLAKSLLRSEVTQWDRDVYNAATKGRFHNFAEFVALHYALSIRTDSEYWKTITNKTFSKEMVNLQPTTAIGFFDLQSRKQFLGSNPRIGIDPNAGITYVSVGMNYPMFDSIDQAFNTHGYTLYDTKKHVDELVKRFNKRKEYWAEAAKSAPSLYEYLRDNVHNNE